MFSLHNLSSGYTNHVVLKNLSLAVSNHSLTLLIGPNGSGKSTLLRVLAGLLSYSGSAALSGSEIRDIPRKSFARSVSFMQSLSSISSSHSFTAEEIIFMSRLPFTSLFTGSDGRDDSRVMNVAQTLGISALLSRKFSSLSDGQKQLTLLAAALAQDTPVILLDEPTSSLDPDKSAMVFSRLRSLAENGRCIVAATHDYSASFFAHEYIALKNGMLVSQGRTLSEQVLSELYDAEFVPYYDKKGSDILWRALPR